MKLKRKYILLKFLFHMMKEGTSDQGKLFEMLGDMRGVPQKYGQFLYLKDKRKYKGFERLLDKGIPYDNQRLYERALALTKHELALEKEPRASASIGQVYKGKLGDEAVVVKIQYPKIKAELEHDWKFLKKMIGLVFGFFRFPQESKNFLVDYLNELEETVDKETDYRLERDYLNRFRGIFTTHPSIHIPKVVDSCTSENVIVEEMCTGIPLKEFLSIAAEKEKRKILYELMFFYFHSFFEHGLLHGDPHSGNFFVKRIEDRLILEVIDYGCVKSYDVHFLESLKALILCLRNGSYEEVYELLLGLGFKQDEILSYGKALVPILNVIFEPFLEDRDFDFAYWRMTYQLNTIMGSKVFEKTMSLPRDLLILFRVFHGFVSHVDWLEDKSFNVCQFVK